MRIDDAGAQSQGAQSLLNVLRLSLASEDSFRSTLSIGQTLTGRVLRHIEGSRYAVSFSGHERTVDSGIPLKTNELLHGRVVGLHDRVELERIRELPRQSLAPPNATDVLAIAGGPPGSAEGLLRTLMVRYGVELDAGQFAAARGIVQAATRPQRTALAALFLIRLGLPVTEALADLLARALGTMPDRRAIGSAVAFGMETAAGKGELRPDPQALQALTGWLDRASAQQLSAAEHAPSWPRDVSGTDTHAGPDTNGGGDRQSSDEDALWRLLNAQKGGSVEHRTASLPIVFDGRLIEFDLACFEQRQPAQGEQTVRHRRIVVDIDCDCIGPLSVDIRLADRRVRMAFDGEMPGASASLSAHADALARRLAEHDWQLDAVTYRDDEHPDTSPAGAVIEHILFENGLQVWA
jgi:hypothetical protein